MVGVGRAVINLNISFPIFDVHKHDYPSSYYVSHTFQLPEPRQTSLLTEACLDGEPDLVDPMRDKNFGDAGDFFKA